jgi:secreted trypsin-like serine protease
MMNIRPLLIRSTVLAVGLAITSSLSIAADDVLHESGVKIVGGQDATIEEFPWQVALMGGLAGWTEDQKQVLCGGTIISKQWILTAAHCDHWALVSIRAGVTNKSDTSGQNIAILRKILHPDYNLPTRFNNDIMLLELAADLDLSGPRAKAIPIMTSAGASSGLANPGVIASISGWGATTQGGASPERLQKAKVPIVANADVVRPYLEIPPPNGPMYVTDKMIAAGLPTGGIDTCQGDSGGPMVVPDANSVLGYRLAGATSFGQGCAQPDYRGLYARVSEFEDWIGNTTGIPVVVTEFYNEAFDHYFITWVDAEAQKLISGATPGWKPTGLTFSAFANGRSGTSAVCRIYIPPGKGDGHFFGRDSAECDGTTQRNPSFMLESSSFFHLFPPTGGACAAGTVPVYRVFSNRTDVNHRYTTSRTVRDQMVAKGWVAEGDGPDAVVMCAP